MDSVEPFEEAEPVRPSGSDDLVLDLDGYEGPIDALLALARKQKVDLTRISILQLADQYLAFIAEARRLRLEIAADYLVMAAWLAYLKSRLLLPVDEDDDEPDGPELAEALTFQLRRLESMREAGARLMALPRLGRDVFARGAPEGVEVVRKPVYDCSLYDILKAYSEKERRAQARSFLIEPLNLFSVSDMISHLQGLIGTVLDWRSLLSFLPGGLRGDMMTRSAVATSLVAGLEMARSGEIELRQSTRFGPIYLRRRSATGAARPQEGETI